MSDPIDALPGTFHTLNHVYGMILILVAMLLCVATGVLTTQAGKAKKLAIAVFVIAIIVAGGGVLFLLNT